MSYYLMVYNKSSAPQKHSDFLNWFNEKTDWVDGFDYNNPNNLSGDLKIFFAELIKIFPPLSGPLAIETISDNEDENNYLTDYSIGKDFVYMAFSWGVSEEAFNTVSKLSEIYDLGFFELPVDDVNQTNIADEKIKNNLAKKIKNIILRLIFYIALSALLIYLFANGFIG